MSRLKSLRQERGFTQGRMARELGTSQQTISRIEVSDDLVPTDILIKASAYFNVSVDYLLGLTAERHNQLCEERMYEYMKDHEGLMLEYVALKPEYQEAVKNVVRTLAEAQEDKE